MYVFFVMLGFLGKQILIMLPNFFFVGVCGFLFSGILNLPKVSTQKLDPALQLNQCGTDRIDVCGRVFSWEPKGTPMPPPPRNKALLRDY